MIQWSPASPTSPTTFPQKMGERVKTTAEQSQSSAQALADAETEQGHGLTRT